MQYYKRYMGDFIRDTGHLTLTERGAYDALLDHYYATMAPLPNDLAVLVRIARAQTKAEVEAVRTVVEQYFPPNGDGFRHNKRADEEIVKSLALSEKQRRNIGKRWDR